QLTSERLRLAAAVAGIAFAAMLVLMQLGFKDALYDSATLVHDHLNFDLALVSPQYQYLIATRSFDEDRLYRALGIDGVDSVTPVYVGLASWLNPESRRDLSVLILGFRLKPGVFRLEGVNENLERLQTADVRVLTRQQFLDLEKSYWQRTAPVGFIFNLGTMMGLFVGAVIVYQILLSDVSDHLPEYATLKAMGYPDRRLFGIVLMEALMLSVLGFIPGLAIAQGLYVVVVRTTFLPIVMTPQRVLLVLTLTNLMCCGAGALAI